MQSGGDQLFLVAHKTRSVRQRAGTVCFNFRWTAIEPKRHRAKCIDHPKSTAPRQVNAGGELFSESDDVDPHYQMVQAHPLAVEDAILIAERYAEKMKLRGR
jgi:hypothetical protein